MDDSGIFRYSEPRLEGRHSVRIIIVDTIAWPVLTCHRYVTLSLNAPTSMNFEEIASLTQDIAGAAAGDAWYFTVDVQRPDFGGVCLLLLRASGEGLTSRMYARWTRPFNGVIDASGIFATAPTSITVSYSCENDGGIPVDTWASFDNLVFWVYPITPSAASTEEPSTTATAAPRQVLVNNDFESGNSDPWQTNANPGVIVSVVNGRAVVDASSVTSMSSQGGNYLQYFNFLDTETNARVEVDVTFDIPSLGGTCHVAIFGTIMIWDFTTSDSRIENVDLRTNLPVGTESLYLSAYCENGPGVITFDNVYLTLNPLPSDTATSTSTSAEVSTTATPAPEQILVNNDFASGTAEPWIPAAFGFELTILDGRANFDGRTIPLEPDSQANGNYRQNFDALGADTLVRLQADVYADILSADTWCNLAIFTESIGVWERPNPSSQDYTVDLYVTLPSGTSSLTLYVYCRRGPAVIAFDNVYLTPNPTSSPTPEPTSNTRELISNNDFESGDLTPWTTWAQNSNPGPTIGIVNGRAVIDWSTASENFYGPAYYVHSFEPVQAETPASLQVDISIDMPTTGITCNIVIYSSEEVLWENSYSSPDYSASIPVRLTTTLPPLTRLLYLQADCSGGAAVIAFDNVYLTLNPTASEPSASTTSSATPVPTPSPASPELLVNNDFESGSYLPWNASPGPGAQIRVANGKAFIDTRGAGGSATNAIYGYYVQYHEQLTSERTARLRANIDLEMLGTGYTCDIQLFGTMIGYWYIQASASERYEVDMPITLPRDTSTFHMEVICRGDALVSFDDIYLTLDSLPSETDASTSTSTSEPTPEPTAGGPRQLIVNNNFESTLDPWAAFGGFLVLVDVADGRAFADFRDTSAGTGERSGYFVQNYEELTSDKPARLQAKLNVDIFDEGASCDLRIWDSGVSYWSASTTAPENYVVDVALTLGIGSSQLYLWAICRGVGALVMWDDVYLEIDPTPTESSTSSPTPESTASGPRQLIVNNDFEGGSYDPWTKTHYDPRSDFAIQDGAAVFTFSRMRAGEYSQGLFEQQLVGEDMEANIGKYVRVTADVRFNIPAGAEPASCFLVIHSVDDQFWIENDIRSSHTYAIDREIVWLQAATVLSFFFGCYGADPTTSISLDNIYLYVDNEPTPAEPSTSSKSEPSPEPTPSGPRQLLVNGDFENGGYAPWAVTHYSPRSELSVVDGKAVFSFPGILEGSWSLAGLDQSLPAEGRSNAGKSARLTAEVRLEIPGPGTATCFLRIHSFDDDFWRQNTVTSPQTFVIDETVIWTEGVPQVTLYVGCYGTDTGTKVSFDNVNLYVDFPTPADTTTSSSSSLESSTPTPTVRPVVRCPENDAETHTNEDGSKYMIVCGQDYSGNNIVGINPVPAADFNACVDLCMYQGTACVGVSWFENTNCYLKYKMTPSPHTEVVVYSAIRMSGPTAGPAASQLVTNGDFASDLPPWTTSRQIQTGGPFIWESGKA